MTGAGTGTERGFAGPLGVSTVDRFRQDLQDASRVSLKWSRGVLLTMMFSTAHTGQVNRITYPVLVPMISGRGDCVVIDGVK